MRSSRDALIPALLAAVLAGGCAQLLPKSQSEVQSGWQSFEEARDAIERIRPGVTTAQDLDALGIDPYSSANVQLLTFSDITLRFPINMPPEQLDDGLRRCLLAGKGCLGYSLSVRDVKRGRTGSFWLDTFGFRRVTNVTGWSFNALILLVDGRVVYTLYGGQPNVREQEVATQPLGPVQGFGESLGSLIK